MVKGVKRRMIESGDLIKEWEKYEDFKNNAKKYNYKSGMGILMYIKPRKTGKTTQVKELIRHLEKQGKSPRLVIPYPSMVNNYRNFYIPKYKGDEIRQQGISSEKIDLICDEYFLLSYKAKESILKNDWRSLTVAGTFNTNGFSCPDCGETLEEFTLCPCMWDAIIPEEEKDIKKPTKEKKCTCGGAIAKTTHSTWCDIYN